MILRTDLVEIGVFNKPHGINGEISLTFKYDYEKLDSIKNFIVEMDGIYVPFFINDIRLKNDITALVLFDGIDTEKEAKIFANKSFYCLKSEIQDDDEQIFDTESLIGFTVKDEKDEFIGEIVDIDDSTENYLFVLENKDDEFYVPIVNDFIIDINIESKVIVMDLPSGIKDL